jgi:hypothetical protein
MIEIDQADLVSQLASQYTGSLQHLSNLHEDFVATAFTAIDASRARIQRPPTGEILPHLVVQGLSLDDKDRRAVTAAWLALFGYICIVDHELDQKGYMNAASSIAASALLGWGVATLGRYTAGTPFDNVFLDNINRAFAAQYKDISVRGEVTADRDDSDADKNRAIVAAMAGFSAASRQPDDRLVRAAEAMLGPFQILDDLEDLQEDHGENNVTIFVRIVRECVAAAKPLTRSDMYGAVIRDSRTLAALQRAMDGADKALLILDQKRDHVLIAYIGELRRRNAALISALVDYQRDPSPVKEPEIMRQIEQVASSSA